jgi:deazaflavin-dependent oxidoreductase (nitroreductase family)
MKANDFVTLLLRSPLHPILGNTMLITVTGRKTGKAITTPVNYARCGSELWVLTSRDRNWWRNISQGTPVRVRMNGRDLGGTADLVIDPPTVASQLLEYVRLVPAAAGPLGLRSPATAPEAAARLSTDRHFVRIHSVSHGIPENQKQS